jgi:hypothetical protein
LLEFLGFRFVGSSRMLTGARPGRRACRTHAVSFITMELPVKVFQLIKKVLDEIYATIPGTEQEKDAAINVELSRLSGLYGNLLRNTQPIDYSDPVTRFAYIYRYVTCHANLVFRRIETNNTLGGLFDQESVQIASIGGGPGSDLLGVLKYCEEAGVKPRLKFLLSDREQVWGESWEDIDNNIDGDFQLRTVYQQLDVTDPATWAFRLKYLHQTDLFTFTYFFSELYNVRQQAAPYFETLFAGARPGAHFLYIDNADDRFNEFDRLADKHGLEYVAGGDVDTRMPLEEQTYDLGIYSQKFRSPKLKAFIAYRIMRKK